MCLNALEFLQVSNMENCAYCQKSVCPGKGVFECQSEACKNIVHYDCKAGYAQLTLDDKRIVRLCVSCLGERVSQNFKLLDENRDRKQRMLN